MLSAARMGLNQVSRIKQCLPPARHPPACHQDLLPVPLSLLPAAVPSMGRAGPRTAPAAGSLLGATELGGVNLLLAYVSIHAALLLLP